LSLSVGNIFRGGSRKPHAAMEAGQQPGLCQALDIAANGLQGD
jgi:hypothetical protein